MNPFPSQGIDPTRLSAEDAYIRSPPTPSYTSELSDNNDASTRMLRKRARDGNQYRSRSRRKTTTFRKLLWVKSPYPDNYTDEKTFLDHLQLNPRMQRYEFWPLVGDSTVIVQQVCAVVVFVCCFSGIIQERVSPVTVVATGSIFTVLGWGLWDLWCRKEEASKLKSEDERQADGLYEDSTSKSPNGTTSGLGLDLAQDSTSSLKLHAHSRSTSTNSIIQSTVNKSVISPTSPSLESSSDRFVSYPGSLTLDTVSTNRTARTQQRIATLKSATLIFGALLGLSPILKSLTKSTASDSIWAIAFWLMCINVFFFDYGGGVGDIFPASLSTNAALMASTVLASRLPSTTQVFSLTLFSIEVFGLFPVFRRYLRHVSKRGHGLLTVSLVMSAGGGTVSMFTNGGWTPAILGIVLGLLVTGIAMGAASFWLISLQVYKNEIHGPWDPARPVIRRRWD